MPEAISKKRTKPGANLPDALKEPFRRSDQRQFLAKCLERLSGLLNYYRIKDTDQNKWFALSWHLANELGLFKTTGPGRNPFWSLEEQVKLLDEVDRIKKISPRKMSTSRAVANLLKKEPEKYPGVDAKTLQNQHTVAKKRSARLVHALVGTDKKAPQQTPPQPTEARTKDSQPKERDIRPIFGLAELGRPKIHPEN